MFNIEDPYKPYEVAYFTAPVQTKVFPEGSNWAYSMPTFAPERKEIWYSEAYTGFYAVKLTNGAWPDPVTAAGPGRAGGTGRGAAAAAGRRRAGRHIAETADPPHLSLGTRGT